VSVEEVQLELFAAGTRISTHCDRFNSARAIIGVIETEIGHVTEVSWKEKHLRLSYIVKFLTAVDRTTFKKSDRRNSAAGTRFLR
jgi:hypothetical protein